jgi:EmrB/QacA subfamily drug resistance transporter
VVLLIGLALPVTDFFVVNVALPTMGRDLHASTGVLELVVSGYSTAYALLLVLGGRLGDALGRRPLFLAGMAAFTVTSAACGLAPDAAVLIAGRVLQGAAAGMLVPQVLATIQATTEGESRARAMGRYGATAGLGMVAGQVLGGVVVALDVAGTGWRGIFLINVPVGIVGFVAATRLIPATRSDRPTGIDVGGTVLLAAALFCLLLPLTQGQSLGWPAWTGIVLALTPLAAGGFVLYERWWAHRGRTPLIPPAIVALPTVRTGLLIALPFFISFGGFMFVYAVATQDSLHVHPLAAGVALVPYALAFFVASLSVAPAQRRFGRPVLPVAAAVQAVSFIGLAVLVAADWPHIPIMPAEVLLVVMGFAQGCVMSPLFRTVLSEVPSHLAGAGSGVLVTAQQSSLALGVAILGTVYTSIRSAAGAGAVLGLEAAIAVFVAVVIVRLPGLQSATETAEELVVDAGAA